MERLDLSVSLTKARRHLSKGLRWPLVLRFALRDFRGGLCGFAIFLASIALGVAAITGIGSVSLSLKDGLAGQGRAILGGDASFDLAQRELSAPERDFLGRQGRLSPVALVRAMARRDDGEAALVEIKAVDETYPLAGEAVVDPAIPPPMCWRCAGRLRACGGRGAPRKARPRHRDPSYDRRRAVLLRRRSSPSRTGLPAG